MVVSYLLQKHGMFWVAVYDLYSTSKMAGNQ